MTGYSGKEKAALAARIPDASRAFLALQGDSVLAASQIWTQEREAVAAAARAAELEIADPAKPPG